MAKSKIFEKTYLFFLAEKVKHQSERVILSLAIVSFIIHLIIIFFVDFKIISTNISGDLLSNPIAAIYTPFSFILLYEVYLLIFYLPKSFTTYIGKQYEIITLIIIRRLFKDLSNLDLKNNWFDIKYDLQFTYDLVTSIVMFFLIYLFYKLSKVKADSAVVKANNDNVELSRFIKIKKAIALILVPLFLVLTFYSFSTWLLGLFETTQTSNSFNNINNVFFEQFFTVLIFADVLILLFSFFITDQFHKVIRNSGFIISTILIRISFSTTGVLNDILIVCAITFGLLIVIIHNQFEKDGQNAKSS